MLWLQPGPFLQEKHAVAAASAIFRCICDLGVVTLERVKQAVSLQTCCKTRGSERAL